MSTVIGINKNDCSDKCERNMAGMCQTSVIAAQEGAMSQQ